MDVHRVYGALMRGFRRRRMARFVAQFDPAEDTRILDVGGTDSNWRLDCEIRRERFLGLTKPYVAVR